jgi:hypothetical protein
MTIKIFITTFEVINARIDKKSQEIYSCSFMFKTISALPWFKIEPSISEPITNYTE